jgi:hypothetical protein
MVRDQWKQNNKPFLFAHKASTLLLDVAVVTWLWRPLADKGRNKSKNHSTQLKYAGLPDNVNCSIVVQTENEL